MSGISSTLSIAKTAITTQQYGLNITGQNIANVNNTDYSIQTAEHKNRTPAAYGGFLFGTGVDMFQVQQSVDKLLEQRLTSELSTQASFEEQESYMRILEGFLDVSSDTSINNILTEFWNSWHDLSNNPQGSSERVAVLESGKTLAAGFEAAVLKMDALAQDTTADMNAAVNRVNTMISQIGALNQKISANEIGRTANDLRDQRNGLLDELGDLIDISVHEKSDGSVIVNAAGSFTLVSGNDTYPLGMKDKQVVWHSSSSGQVVISDKIQGGRLGGVLEMRDTIIPKYRAEIDALSREMIWAINYQHSQGAGLTYFTEPVVGDYAADESRWLTSFEFGDKIDPTQEFNLWVEDKSVVETQYTQTKMDMEISQAKISNWQGVAPGGVQSIYKLTVVDDAVLGDRQVTETDGDGLAMVQGGATVSAALSAAIAAQTLTVYNGPSGTGVIDIKDVGGNAKPSAGSIAAALNRVDGVTAYASETSAAFDLAGIISADEGDLVKFSLVVDGLVFQQEFVRGPSALAIEEQFEGALRSGVESFNQINEDQDLFVEGLTLTSRSGRTLGVQDFEVQDNAGVKLSSFSGFNPGDTLGFNINGTQVSVDLTGVDTSDNSAMALAFSNAIALALEDKPFTVKNEVSTNTVVIRTTDGSGITLDNVSAIGGNPDILITGLAGTSIPLNNTLTFDGADSVVANATTVNTNTLDFIGNGTSETLVESSVPAGVKAGVITGTVSVLLEAGMEIVTSVSGPGSGGLFSSSYAKVGSSIMTLGGEGGFAGFDPAGGETISFDLDGTPVSFVTAAGGTSDVQLATQLATQIVAGLTAANVQNNYQVIQTSTSVSIIKNKSLDDPIKIENFSELSGNNVTLRVRTGTGTGSNQPENDLLEADLSKSYRNAATSSLYKDDGVIMWERLDKNGAGTGANGLIRMEDEGRVTIVEQGLQTLSFDISKGSLVAGNTLTLNTNTLGQPDPLDFRITGRANSINDSYQFRVVSGGKVGHLPGLNDPPLVIQWRSSVKTGTFTIQGNDPPYTPQTPVEVQVDGMNLKFSDGTLFKGDVFTLTTGDTGIPLSLNSAGQPTGEKLSDWHWTLDSFAEQFNRVGNGIKASATLDNRLKFQASDTYYTLENIQYSGNNGFDKENVSLSVKDWGALNFKADDLRFERSSAGTWGVMNDPTGGALQILPQGGDDHGFGVDFSGDGLADIQIRFQETVSGQGYVEFDLKKKEAKNIGFAFSDNGSSDSGLAAAAGINTFFKGYDAMTMEINGALTDTRRIAAAVIERGTGRISQGDNTNALALADVQYQDRKMILWNFQRGADPYSSTTIATLDDYFTQMISSMGIKSRSIKNSKEFADMMVNNITEQRNSVSAVSLDEEMIKLMKYQHAFAAASKLLNVSDEMLNTLIAMR